jgi:RNA polymerase sigma factor (sigma-70 family)
MALRGEGDAVEDLVRQYLREIGAYPLLTASDEIMLATAMGAGREASTILGKAGAALSPARRRQLESAAQTGHEAKRRFIQANLRLVVSIAKRYQNPGLSLLDLVQEGNLGLMRAVDKFEPDRGCKFSTYATWWIRQAVSRAIADKGRAIRVPVHMVETSRRVGRATARLTERLGRSPTPHEIAIEADLPLATVVDVQSLVEDPVSISSPMGEDSELLDVLPDHNAQAPFDKVTADMLHRELHDALTALTTRERQVLQLRFGLAGSEPHTLEDVGRTFRLTRERIRQIEAKALTKLRHPATPNRLRVTPAALPGGDPAPVRRTHGTATLPPTETDCLSNS